MDSKSLKEYTIRGSLIVTMVSVFPALATSTGVQLLGKSETAGDAFTFTCPDGTISARANVEDLAPANPLAKMRAMLERRFSAAQTTDVNPPGSAGENTSDSTSTPSGNAVLSRGPGFYLASFFKTAKGEERYRGSVVCRRSSESFDPDLTRTQNQ